jgi:Protein of unknown function (DUF1217)
MSFQPVVPMSGIAGWRFLQRTQEKQQATFANDAELKREIAYFDEKIGSVTSAADLVADRRLLKVALGAFGLQDDIGKKAFIRKVLEEGTTAEDALAVRLTDPAYKKLSAAFGFGDAGGARTGAAGFAPSITAAYRTRAFETAVGDVNDNMRLALNFQREIAGLAEGEGKSWYSILGSKPLREVVDKAFGLPKAFAQLDIDKQVEILKDKSSALFGSESLTVFQDQALVGKLIDRFLARAQIEDGVTATGPAANALALLQGMNSSSGSSGIWNLLASNA